MLTHRRRWWAEIGSMSRVCWDTLPSSVVTYHQTGAVLFNDFNVGPTLKQLNGFTLLSFFLRSPLLFKPEFTIVIFIHYKSRIAIAILDL